MLGINSAGRTGYTPPCPPKAQPHIYVFTVYLLDQPINLERGALLAILRDRIKGHVLAQGTLRGKYER